VLRNAGRGVPESGTLQSNRERRHVRGIAYRKEYDHPIEIRGRRAPLGPASGRILAHDDHPHLPAIDKPAPDTEPHPDPAPPKRRATAVGSVFWVQSRV